MEILVRVSFGEIKITFLLCWIYHSVCSDRLLLLEEMVRENLSSDVGCSCSPLLKVVSTKFGGFRHQGRSLKSKSVRSALDQCAYCKIFGHWKKDCHKLLEKNKKKGMRPSVASVIKEDGIDSITSDYSLPVSPSVRCSDDAEWMLDTDSTYHVCPKRERFASFEKLEGVVLMGNDHACRLCEIGTIRINMGDGMIKEFRDVRYVPSVKKNISQWELWNQRVTR